MIKTCVRIFSTKKLALRNKMQRKYFQLTPNRIIAIFICEIIVETYYGFSFFFAVDSQDKLEGTSESCLKIRDLCRGLAILYMTEIAVAFVNLALGMIFFISSIKLFIRVYKGVTNVVKTISILINLTFLTFIAFYYYTKNSQCVALDDLGLGGRNHELRDGREGGGELEGEGELHNLGWG